MNTDLNIVILAAGKGTRMRSDLPKVLHALGGKPILGHLLDRAREVGPRRIVVVHGHGAQQVQQAFAAGDIQWALQEPQQGTGHAVQQATPLLDPDVPTLVLVGDVPLIRASTLQALIGAAGSDALAVLTVNVDDATGYGRIVREGGTIRRIVEHQDASEAERAIREINTGIMVAPTGKLIDWLSRLKNHNVQNEYYLTDIVALAVADGVPVRSAQPAAVWETLGINSKSQLAALERQLQRNLADRLMDGGVTLADPARIDVRGTLLCGRDVSIDIGCVFEGTVHLGDGVRIGPHCVLRDAQIAAGAVIEAFSHVDGARIGANARIGPYARLRPGTDLAEDVHIGNFTEVKNSSFGAGSKANHLSYVGDATVGARVNVGAGTITCNYDGANKHRTVIEDDVHIGSDTQLVAPVTVGAGSTVAAGTTIWKDVPPDTLALNDKTQVARSGWKRPAKKPKA